MIELERIPSSRSLLRTEWWEQKQRAPFADELAIISSSARSLFFVQHHKEPDDLLLKIKLVHLFFFSPSPKTDWVKLILTVLLEAREI